MAGLMLNVRSFGLCPYSQVWAQMKKFTDERSAETNDELWLVEHPSVFTLGQAGKPEHILNPGDIPIVQSDRGGQVTYHEILSQVSKIPSSTFSSSKVLHHKLEKTHPASTLVQQRSQHLVCVYAKAGVIMASA